MATDHDTIKFLPEDLIFKVFLLLPVKDLLRSKLVCKSWLSLICSSAFVKTHLSKSINDPQFTHHRLLLSYQQIHSEIVLKSCSINLLLNGPVNDPETVKIDYQDAIISVVGSCNGLICLEGYDNYFFFWNPSTRKIRRLPKIDITHRYQTHGFCYDESNDEFKVFLITTTNWKFKMSVYSSKTDAWRSRGDFVECTLMFGGYLGNGALHWVVCPLLEVTIRSPILIGSVDIKRETYREIMLPNSGDGKNNWAMGTLDDSLYALSNRYDDSRADLWVMREGDGEVSWIKLLTIPHMDRLTRQPCIKPICFTANGEIMLLSDSKLVLYNTKDQTYKNLLNNITSRNLKLHTYVESLISP